MLLHNDELISQLRSQLKSQIEFVRTEMRTIPADSLNFRPEKGKWSALECIEHLNLVFDWYLPRIKKQVQQASDSDKTVYKTGFFGDRMVDAMMPKEEKVKNRMKTFRRMKPERSKREKGGVLKQFEEYMTEFDDMIDRSSRLDLGGHRITSAVGNVLRFKLGDCYRFLLAHNDRHMLQCRNALKVLATHQ